jgi:chromatin modification-related protein VID21
MVVKNNSPPRKRSRYEFEEDDDQTPEHKTVDIDPSYGFYRPKRVRYERSPERNDVALFNPENKPIRDRIHAGHLFRPPSEHPMPPQGFFECRGVAQWTFAEEEELKSLVKEYCYNWSLISSIVSSRSAFSSSAERRTPWECFERWISIEGLPLDMQKTQYFRALHSRLDAAKHPSQYLPGHHQGGPNNASLTPLRRRDTRSVRVERRKNTRHLSLIDAIRKVAKKRETTVQKLQHGMR